MARPSRSTARPISRRRLTGPLYQESAAGARPVRPVAAVGDLIDNLGDILLKAGVTLVKGDDVACGSKQCYTVSADLTADDLGRRPALTGLPVDLTGRHRSSSRRGSRRTCRTTSRA